MCTYVHLNGGRQAKSQQFLVFQFLCRIQQSLKYIVFIPAHVRHLSIVFLENKNSILNSFYLHLINITSFFPVISNKLDGDMLSIIIKCVDYFIDQGKKRVQMQF